MRLRFDLRHRLKDTGLASEIVERAIADTRVEVWIRATRRDSFALGRSRIGGVPDLPRGVAWPRYRWTRDETTTWSDFAQKELADAIASGIVIAEDDHVALALTFVAQLDLAQLAPHQEVLPRRGHLWFFAEQSTAAGTVENYPTCASACLFAGGDEHDAELVTATPPPTIETLPAFSLAFTTERALPGANDLGLSGDDWHRYNTAWKKLDQPSPRHACLGRPEYGSVAPVPPDGYTGLLRVDSDYGDGYTLNWGDAAFLTFAIPDAALAARRFDEVRAFRWIG